MGVSPALTSLFRGLQAKSATAGGSLESPAGWSPDLEGLRGVAILLVLLFHAQLIGVTGGYIGVDVFFVLSGFLITGLLLREADASRTINLAAFYARRVRRILPAAFVVLGVTLAAAALIVSPLDLPDVAGDAAAAAASVGNIRFAIAATDYFSADRLPSPLLHYWSLGVEEQFYLLWPGLLIVGMRLTRLAPSRAVVLLLVPVVAVSFVASYLVTAVSQPLAFYLLPTRAWQLALGGLLAALAPTIARAPRHVLKLGGWTGLLAVVGAAFVFSPTTEYPGLAALVPSLGSAAIIVSAAVAEAGPMPLRWRPLRFLGMISFSLYLVHWPVFILARNVSDTGADLGPGESVALVALSIALAWLCYRFVELPFHRARWTVSLPPRRVLAPAAVAMALLVSISGWTSVQATQALDTLGISPAAATTPASGGDDADAIASPLAASVSPSVDDASPVPAGRVVPSGLPSGAPPNAPQPSATPPEPVVATATGPLPRDVRPSVGQARNDWEQLHQDGCTLGNLDIQIVNCVFGDPNGAQTVALVGDSHAAQWFPALDALATQHHWRLVPLTKLSCRFLDLPMYSLILNREYSECDTWKGLVLQRLKALRPDLTIVVAAHGMTPIDPADGSPVVQGQAMARYLVQIPGQVAVIVDPPGSLYDVPDCLARHLDDVSRCATPRSLAASNQHNVLEQTATRLAGAALVDMTDAICNSQVCPAVIDDMIVYRDNWHLTATFVGSLTQILGARLPAIDAPPAAGPILQVDGADRFGAWPS
jgi:peptidoglycan/LPS O-acetylase OafA/YrhL